MKLKIYTILICLLTVNVLQAQWGEFGFEDCNNPWVLCNSDTETETESDDTKDKEKKENEEQEEEKEGDKYDDWFKKIEVIRDPWANDPPPNEPPPTNDPPTENPPTETPPGRSPPNPTPPSELKPWSDCGPSEKNYIIAKKQLNKRIILWDYSDKIKWRRNWQKTKIGTKKRVSLANGNKYTFILQARKDHKLSTKRIYEITYKVVWKNKKGRLVSSPLFLRIFPDKIIAYTRGK